MKNLAKLLLAVVALFAYSCATDTTEDLGVQVGGGQTTEITLSLEESRTQLGEEVDGFYPLYWSEGDAISVNGTASAALSAAQAGSAAATFVVDGTLATPYCIAYPAAPAGKVLFAENQTHVGNTTFGSGISTMYAYGTNSGVQLNHLTGVLKIGIVGDATITKAQISTADRTPIAGAFNFDFEKGVATAAADSKSVINYSFGEGVKLASDPTYIHAVVPAGVYDELYVTLFDAEGGVMYAIVKADDTKPLTAGKIRTFSNTINYAPTNVTIIKDKESLLAWAADSASTTDVVLAADIDMTGETWTTVASFDGIFRGNGYAIKGLTAPLFGDVNAKAITGVHLVDVDINATNNPNVGAVAGWLKNTDAVVSNCSASGKITLNYDGTITTTPYLAGVVSRLDSATELKSLVSNVAIEVTGKYAACCIGGVVAYAINNPLTNCTNLGTITFSGEATGVLYIGGVSRMCNTMTNCVNGSKDDKTHETAKIVVNGTAHGDTVVVGGIVEAMKCPGQAINENNHNYANIYYQSPSAKNYIQLCGIVRNNANNQVYWKNCTNHGNIIASGGSDKSFIIGGFEPRHFNNQYFQYCENHGDITVTAEANVPAVFASGMIGTNDDTGECVSIQYSTNYGDVSVYSSIPTKVYIGGMNGKIECGQFLVGDTAVDDMISHNYGTILYEANNADATVYAGGIVGIVTNNLTSGVKAATTAFRLANVINHGNVTVNGTCGTVNIGGLCGRIARGNANGTEGSKFHNVLHNGRNKGTLTINAAVKSSDCAIGGLHGYLIHTYSGAGGNWVNEGKMVFTGEVSNGRLLIGGYVGATDQAFSGKSNTIYNFGDIECTGTIKSSAKNRIGGIFGQMNKTIANCHAYCKIKAIGLQDSGIVGMITGCTRTTAVIASNCSLGGSLCYSTEDDFNADGDLIGTKDALLDITAENYTNHIYGAVPNWSGVENYDGCTFLSEKPAL